MISFIDVHEEIISKFLLDREFLFTRHYTFEGLQFLYNWSRIILKYLNLAMYIMLLEVIFDLIQDVDEPNSLIFDVLDGYITR